MFYVWLLTENPGKTGAPGDAKLLFKSSTVRVSVVKKPASNVSNSAKLEVNHQGTQTNNTSPLSNGNNSASTGQLSLVQNYDSEDD